MKDIELLFNVMNNGNDVTLTDGSGVILKVSDSYEKHYVKREDIIGKTVYEMEELGIFRPSVTAAVLRERRKMALDQVSNTGKKVRATGIPIFSDDGDIQYVISFNTEYLPNDKADELLKNSLIKNVRTLIKKITSKRNNKL